MKNAAIAFALGMLLLNFDPRTGITSYQDVPTDDAQPAPSTATSFAPAPVAPSPTSPAQGYSQSDFYGLTSNLGWDAAGGSKGFDMPLYAINPRTGQPEMVQVVTVPGENGFFDAQQTYYFPSDGTLPGDASQGFAGGHSYGNDRNTILEPGIIAGLSAISGGMFGPALAGATGMGTAASTGAVAGATGGGIASSGDPQAIAQGAVVGGLGGGVASGVSNFAGGGMLGATLGGLAGGGLGSLANGGDVGQGALLGGLTSGAARGAGELYADFTAPPAPPTDTAFTDASTVFDPLKRGMFSMPPAVFDDPAILASADNGIATDVAPGLLADATVPPSMPPAILDTGGAGMMPAAVPPADPTFGGALTQTAPGVYSVPPTDAQLREQKVAKAAATAEKLGKLGAALAQMHEGRGQPADAPQRQDGQSDDAYAQTLVQYANLDPQTLADAGLTPGTPEYYQFVMDQMDSIINQTTGGVDVDSADLAAQLRGKTREELDALDRALYVRGQMGQLLGAGKYTDPFTGVSEQVIAPNGQRVQPSVAAYQRGLARSANELAGLQPEDARRFVGGMLDRNPDLFGMQASHDARMLDEILSQQDYDDPMKRRQRGMFGDSAYLQSQLGGLSDNDLAALLGNTRDPRAALEALLGR